MSKQAAPRKVGDKEALAVGNTIRGSARKLNLVAQLIRGRKVEEALNILKFSPKGMSEDVYKVLASAVANAENNNGADVVQDVVAWADRIGHVQIAAVPDRGLAYGAEQARIFLDKVLPAASCDGGASIAWSTMEISSETPLPR